jgi:HEAT repeat protein
MWSCPRCGEQMDQSIPVCSRCGGPPGVFPVPAKRCPSCRAEVEEPAREGRIRCPKCSTEFGDYEEWVRLCRAAAFAAIRPVPPPPEEPPPRPPHLKPIGVSLLAMAAFYAAAGLIVGQTVVLVACLALALLQVIAGACLLTERKHSDVMVRLAAGLSALLPLFLVPAVYFVGLFGFFSRPLVVKYFGGRVDPIPDRLRHPLIAWLLVVVAIVAGLFAFVVSSALETAAVWNDPLTPALDLGRQLSGFFGRNWWWAPVGIVAGLWVLAVWGKVSRHAFLVVSILALLGVVGLGAPPIVDGWSYDRSAREATTYLVERNVQRLLWGVTVTDPRIRLASIRAMEAAGSNARVAAPALIRALKDPDRRVRLAAASALAQFEPGVEGVLPLLLGALEDDRASAAERGWAGVALSHYGPRARPALGYMLELLRSGDATFALAEMGPAAIPGVTEALSDKDAAVRRRAARVLRLLGPAARSAVPQLTARLKDSDPDVRSEAASALGAIDGEKAIPVLRAMLQEDKAASKAAAEALCALGQKEGAAHLPNGSPSLNVLRLPAMWDHLSKSVLDRDVEGSGTEILVELGERAGMCAEVSPEASQLPALAPFRRIYSGTRRRSVLDVLTSFDVDFVLESDRIRVVTPEQARAFWAEWLAESRKKKE